MAEDKDTGELKPNKGDIQPPAGQNIIPTKAGPLVNRTRNPVVMGTLRKMDERNPGVSAAEALSPKEAKPPTTPPEKPSE